MRLFLLGCLLAACWWLLLGQPDLSPGVARSVALAGEAMGRGQALAGEAAGRGQALAAEAWTAAQTAIPAPRIAINGTPVALPTAGPAAPAPAAPVAPLPTVAPVAAGSFTLTEQGPVGCPVVAALGRVVMTQGYGIGTHAPAEIWGAVDLAVDGDGDGNAEAEASWYTPIVAAHDGVVTVTLDSQPAGNHVWVNEPGGVWRTGYSHLAQVTVVSGQFVRAGEQIGLIRYRTQLR